MSQLPRPFFGKTRASAAEIMSCLPPIYGWFTEVFDTSDRKEAKALLNEPA